MPTFRGEKRLRLFYERYKKEVSGFEDIVHLHINDNSSDYERPVSDDYSCACEITKNNKNLGIASNINKVFDFNRAHEYTWILGDDDLLTPGSIKRLLELLVSRDPDYVFVNTVTFPKKIKERVVKDFFKTSSLPLKEGNIKSKMSRKVIDLKFSALINPEVDEVLLGSLMCGVFKTGLVQDHSSENFPNGTKLSVWSSYPHVINYANSLSPDATAIFDPFIYTFNFWDGGNTWKEEYNVTVALGILNSIKHFSENGHLDSSQEAELIKHYLSVSSSSRKQLYEISDDLINKQFAVVSPYLMSRLNKHSFVSKSDLCIGLSIKLWLLKIIPKSLFETLRGLLAGFKVLS